jgi:dTDP-4-dehydrorhamnose reductase
MNPPILVTGGSGQLALATEQAARARGLAIRRVGRPEFDFDRPATIDAIVAATEPALVVNAAAYTAVDAAEDDGDAALRANRDGPARLAELCQDAGIPLIHVSTDYVFDGSKGAPYVETDPTSPTGTYGASKLAGEEAVLTLCPNAIVLRTAWVYSPGGKNFVRTMLNAARKTGQLRVVADQCGSPTAAADLGEAILDIVGGDIVGNPGRGWLDQHAGLYHACGSGWTTWHGFAVAIFEEAARYGAPVPSVAAIATSEWPTPAKRPPDSRLDCGKLERTFGVRLPSWRASLARTIAEIFCVAESDHTTSGRV